MSFPTTSYTSGLCRGVSFELVSQEPHAKNSIHEQYNLTCPYAIDFLRSLEISKGVSAENPQHYVRRWIVCGDTSEGIDKGCSLSTNSSTPAKVAAMMELFTKCGKVCMPTLPPKD